MVRKLWERKGIMWVVMSTRHAERRMSGRKRENNTQRRENMRRRPSKCCVSAVHSSLAHTASKRRVSQGRTYPLKKGRGRKEGRGWGKTMLPHSLGPQRGNDQTLSFTSAADGRQGPSTLICFLFCYNTLYLFLHLSSIHPRPFPLQASPCNWQYHCAASCTVL